MEDRIRIENAFPAIIDRGTWEAVQEVNRMGPEKCSHRSKPQKCLYSGLLACADCGTSISYSKTTKTYREGKRIGCGNFQCRTYQATGGARCLIHSVPEVVINNILLSDIRRWAEQITLDADAML